MDRPDLGKLFGDVTRRLIEAERPLVAAHALSMWGYVALSELARGSVVSQLALADAMSYDKNRLVTLLDELESAGLVVRQADPDDRRVRIVALTEVGRRRHAAVRRDIRAMEDELLADLDERERTVLMHALAQLGRRHNRRSPQRPPRGR